MYARSTGAEIIVTVLVAACAAMPAYVHAAALSGFNGRILFTSGRGGAPGDDAQAKIYMRTVIGSAGGGTVSAALTPTAGVQFKHPAWSPDRKYIVYSRGTPGTFLTEDFDIYVQDMTTGVATPITTPGDGVTSDRAAWSPDGTRIAYDNETGTNNTGKRDIFIQNMANGLPVGSPINRTNTPTLIETKAAWTPDSQTIYFAVGDPTGVNTMDIHRMPAGGGMPTLAVPDSGLSEFQPSISPDGSQICFTLGDGFSSNTSIIVAPIANPASGTVLATGNGGNINCVFSPDGTKVMYVNGVFAAGGIVFENADNTSLSPIFVEDVPSHFDGNPDWAPDGTPVCRDEAIQTSTGTPVTIPLDCVDTGPDYEKTTVAEFITSDPPINGTLGDPVPGTPYTVIYTPNPGFNGVEIIKYNGFDARQFASPERTITITVAPAPIATTTTTLVPPECRPRLCACPVPTFSALAALRCQVAAMRDRLDADDGVGSKRRTVKKVGKRLRAVEKAVAAVTGVKRRPSRKAVKKLTALVAYVRRAMKRHSLSTALASDLLTSGDAAGRDLALVGP
jgi:Tol biopolymer transport system component